MKKIERDDILKILETGSVEEKSTVLENILESGDNSSLDLLVDSLEKEKSRAVKERIILVLTRLIPASGFKHAEQMLRSSDPFVRNSIVEIIKHSNTPIIQFLEKLAEDRDKDVRKFVIDSLSQEKSDRAIEIIRNRLDDPEINILYTAVEYLGNFKDDASVEKIEAIILSSDNFMVLCSGLEALAKIRRSPQKDKISRKFTDTYANPAITFPFLKYLGAFGDNGALTYIENIMDRNPGTYAKEVIDSIEGIVKNRGLKTIPHTLQKKLEIFRDETANTVDKYAVTKLLMKTAGKDKKDLLGKIRQMLEEENEMTRLCAIEILSEIGDRSDIVRLEQAAENTDSDELLEAIGDAVEKMRK